jgi:hypothetical protein
MKFSKSFWRIVAPGAVICFVGISGMGYYLCSLDKWNTGIIYSRFWLWLPRVSMLSMCLGFALIAAWLIVAFITKLVLRYRFKGVQLMEGTGSSMKTSQFIFVCLLVFALSSALGFIVGVRIGFRQSYNKELSDYSETAYRNEYFQARAYYRCLQSIDSGDITNFHAFALADLREYVWDFQQSRQEGYDWAQNVPYLYSNAIDYIAEHPSKESGEGRRPNNTGPTN